MLVIPAAVLRRWKQEDHKFEAIPKYRLFF
jgi:hypothetical protein